MKFTNSGLQTITFSVLGYSWTGKKKREGRTVKWKKRSFFICLMMINCVHLVPRIAFPRFFCPPPPIFL